MSMAVLRGGQTTETKAGLIKRGRSISSSYYLSCWLWVVKNRVLGSTKPTFLCSDLKCPLPSLRRGSDEALLGCCHGGVCSPLQPCGIWEIIKERTEEKEMGELRGQCWQMREESLGSMSLLKNRLGRSTFSVLPESGSSKGEALRPVI